MSKNWKRLRETFTFSHQMFQYPEGRPRPAAGDSEENVPEKSRLGIAVGEILEEAEEPAHELTLDERRLKTASQLFHVVSILFMTVIVPALVCLSIVTTYLYAIPITMAISVLLTFISKYYHLRYWYYKTRRREADMNAGPQQRQHASHCRRTEMIYELQTSRQIPASQVEWREEVDMAPQQKRIVYSCVAAMLVVVMIVLPLLAAEFAIEFMADETQWSLYAPYLFAAGVSLAIFFISKTILGIITKDGVNRNTIYTTRDKCSQIIVPCLDIRKDIVSCAGTIQEELRERSVLLRKVTRAARHELT